MGLSPYELYKEVLREELKEALREDMKEALNKLNISVINGARIMEILEDSFGVWG